MYYTIEYNGKIYTAVKAKMHCVECAFLSTISPSKQFTQGRFYCKLPVRFMTRECMCPLMKQFPKEHMIFIEFPGGI